MREREREKEKFVLKSANSLERTLITKPAILS